MKIARRTLWGLAGSIVWIALVIGYTVWAKGWPDFSAMKLNELGDYLAGAAAPLAFLWLVIGYYQQGEELELQRKELELQRKETARLADQAAAQADAIKANELHARKDTFLRFAELVLPDVNMLIAQMLGHSVVKQFMDQRWRKYQAGDSRVFVQSAIRALKERPDDWRGNGGNPKMDPLLSAYIDSYRRLLQMASESDPSDVLRSHFEHSPYGSLYGGICFVNGQSGYFCIRSKFTGVDEIR